MPGPTDTPPTTTKAPTTNQPLKPDDKKQEEQQSPADKARENLALAAWAKPEDKKEVAAPPERKALARLEGVEEWEKVEKDAGKKSNYLDVRQNILMMLPYIQVENTQGKVEDDFKTS